MCVSAGNNFNKTVDYSAKAENRNVFFEFVFYQDYHRYYIIQKIIAFLKIVKIPQERRFFEKQGDLTP